MKAITEQFPKQENEAFFTLAYTIGGMMVFPGNQIDGMKPIRATRGLNKAIADRFDLTLECIRCHCVNKQRTHRRDRSQCSRQEKTLC
jgi:hypothetical protein